MRKVRIKRENAIYHVIARANRGEFIMNTSEMKKIFIHVLEKAKKKYNFELKHFCIMSNHIHLLIKPTKNTDISKLMQWILSVFAGIYNKIFKLKGHVWYDRFKSKIIETLQQYLKTFEYISDNPLKAGICKCTSEYDFCALKYIRQTNSNLLDPPDLLISMFFPDFSFLLLSN